MILIKTIHIEEFRGIRDLDLEFDAKNFGICGPNGTGKSGVVDAIEFCLTGDITRLSGQGSGDLSVKAHAPHVDHHDHPEKAKVTITADIPSLKKSVTLHRSVKTPHKVSITPDDADVKAVIQELQSHSEFALSRREIVKYIITPPGKRSEDVQTLLRLDHLERLRKSFTTFNNSAKREASSTERTRAQCEADLRNGLKIAKLEHEKVLEAVNERREILGLPVLTQLKKDTSFKSGVAVPKDKKDEPVLRKATALTDISALVSTIEDDEPPALAKSLESAKNSLENLKADEKALVLARQHGFIKTGLDLITEDACPLCDTKWDAEELRQHLKKKLLSAKEIAELLDDLRKHISTILQSLSARIQSVERTIQYCQKLNPPIEKNDLDSYLKLLKESEAALNGFLKDHSAIDPALEAVSKSWWLPDKGAQSCIQACQKAVKALPDASAEDQAREFLIIAQERYEKLLRATMVAKMLKAQSQVAQKTLDHYNDSCTTVLEGIYDDVAKDFTDYYRVINREDEEKFVGKLSSGPAKLNFDVDFYGRGLFPPGAYHSEGHQDGMGLCLYLALMKHTLGDKFTFTVLDDVLMSVDTGHRREVCRLLKTEFPDTQFILTTHDRVWLQYMKTEGLIVRSQSFGGWTVDSGPRIWDDHDIWAEIQSELDKDDVPKAAWLLRRYLEFTANVLADNLRARVEFRGDGHYDLGDLLPHVLKEWRKRLEQGEKSAEKWGLMEEKEAIASKRAKAKALVAKSSVKQWAINPSVHFNEWMNLQGHEFQEVVDAFKELLENLRCDNEHCKSYLYVSPRKGNAEELRCNCGATSINLKTSA